MTNPAMRPTPSSASRMRDDCSATAPTRRRAARRLPASARCSPTPKAPRDSAAHVLRRAHLVGGVERRDRREPDGEQHARGQHEPRRHEHVLAVGARGDERGRHAVGAALERQATRGLDLADLGLARLAETRRLRDALDLVPGGVEKVDPDRRAELPFRMRRDHEIALL
jgi:hypothetical protein